MPDLVEEARMFAEGMHRGQRDKIGADYFTSHAVPVANYTREYGGSIEQVVAAYLHDTVEDTHTTLEQIAVAFGDSVSSIVDALTRRGGESYMQFIRRCVETPDAVLVKLADIRSNTDPARVMYLPRDVRIRQATKYGKALPVLWAHYEGR